MKNKFILLIATTFLLAGCGNSGSVVDPSSITTPDPTTSVVDPSSTSTLDPSTSPSSTSSVEEETIEEKAFEALQSMTTNLEHYDGDLSFTITSESMEGVRVFDNDTGADVYLSGITGEERYCVVQTGSYDSTNEEMIYMELPATKVGDEIVASPLANSITMIKQVDEQHVFYRFGRNPSSATRINYVDVEKCAPEYTPTFFEEKSNLNTIKTSLSNFASFELLLTFFENELTSEVGVPATSKQYVIDLNDDVYSAVFSVTIIDPTSGLEVCASNSFVFNEQQLISYGQDVEMQISMDAAVIDPGLAGCTMKQNATVKAECIYKYTKDESIMIGANEQQVLENANIDYNNLSKIDIDVSFYIDGHYLYYITTEYEEMTISEVIATRNNIGVGDSTITWYLDKEMSIPYNRNDIACIKDLHLYGSSTPNEGYAVVYHRYSFIDAEGHLKYDWCVRETVSITSPLTISFSTNDKKGGEYYSGINDLEFTSIEVDGDPITKSTNTISLTSRVYVIDYVYDYGAAA